MTQEGKCIKEDGMTVGGKWGKWLRADKHEPAAEFSDLGIQCFHMDYKMCFCCVFNKLLKISC